MTREERAAQVRAERKAREKAQRKSGGRKNTEVSETPEAAGIETGSSERKERPLRAGGRADRSRKAEAAAESRSGKGSKGGGLSKAAFYDKTTPLQRLLLALIISFMLIMVLTYTGRYHRIREEHKLLVEQNEALKEQKQDVEMELKNSGTKDYIQEQARKKLRLLNEDETIFIFEEDEENDKQAEN